MGATRYESTRAIGKTLREMGFRSRRSIVKGRTVYADFHIRGLENSAGERLCTHVFLNDILSEHENLLEEIWGLREEIERRTAELGTPFYVRKRRYGNTVTIVISNDSITRRAQNVDLPFGKVA